MPIMTFGPDKSNSMSVA